jgi:hypothetical protein
VASAQKSKIDEELVEKVQYRVSFMGMTPSLCKETIYSIVCLDSVASIIIEELPTKCSSLVVRDTSVPS